MKWGVVRFPGSLDDGDALHALATVMGENARILWHKETTLDGAECVLLPGGFSYGDYLRTGAIARFSPIMKSIAKFAADGGLVIGTCNPARSREIVRYHSYATASGSGSRTLTRRSRARRSRATCCVSRSSMARDFTSRPKMNSARWKSAGK